jgi:hypothetical protein
MRGAAWISLLRIIPQEMHAKLMVVMSSGNEINIYDIVRIEQEFAVVRGRLAGTTDEPTVVFVPLEQIDYLGFRVPMKDAEVQELLKDYGAPPMDLEEYRPAPAPAPIPRVAAVAPAPAAPAPAPAAASPAPAPPPAPVPTAPAAAPAPAGSISQILPGKAALLERLRRSRLNQDSPKSREG